MVDVMENYDFDLEAIVFFLSELKFAVLCQVHPCNHVCELHFCFMFVLSQLSEYCKYLKSLLFVKCIVRSIFESAKNAATGATFERVFAWPLPVPSPQF